MLSLSRIIWLIFGSFPPPSFILIFASLSLSGISSLCVSSSSVSTLNHFNFAVKKLLQPFSRWFFFCSSCLNHIACTIERIFMSHQTFCSPSRLVFQISLFNFQTIWFQTFSTPSQICFFFSFSYHLQPFFLEKKKENDDFDHGVGEGGKGK